MAKRAGTYNVLNVWRLEAGSWHDCKSAYDRPAGETRWMPMARRGTRRVVARNRRPGEVDRGCTDDAARSLVYGQM